MNELVDALFLGVYVPIVVLSLRAVWLFGKRLLLPAVRGRHDLRDYWLGVGAACALASHALENAWYGVARWFGIASMLTGWPLVVGAMKVLILAGCVFVIAAARRLDLSSVAWSAAAWWCVGVVLALVFA